MNDKEIEEILDNALINRSNTSEKESDKVGAASSIYVSRTLKFLSSKIENITYSLGPNFEILSRAIGKFNDSLNEQVNKVILSNEKLSESNEFHAKWMRVLTIALIVTTLIVGLLQAFVIWKN